MKKYLIYLFTLASTLLIGCDSFRDMSGAAEVNPITVDVYLDITVENISTLKDLTVFITIEQPKLIRNIRV